MNPGATVTTSFCPGKFEVLKEIQFETVGACLMVRRLERPRVIYTLPRKCFAPAAP